MLRTVFIFVSVIHLMDCYRITPIQTPETNFVAAPYWDKKTQCLYFIDFVSPNGTKSIYRYDYKTRQFYGAYVIGEMSPSFIIPVKGCKNQFIIGLDQAIKVIQWDGISETATVVRPLFNVFGHFNYATTDKKGRLYTGTINNTIFCTAPSEYSTYRYTKCTGVTQIFANLKMTTGLAISEKRGKLYHADACRYEILEFDYDPSTGDVCNGRVIFDFKNSGINPLPLILGISLDHDGNLFVGLYESYEVWKIDPRTSAVLQRLRFKSRGVSDAVFGGPNMDVLFVTATKLLVKAYGGGILETRPQDPTLYMVEGLGTRGCPQSRVIV